MSAFTWRNFCSEYWSLRSALTTSSVHARRSDRNWRTSVLGIGLGDQTDVSALVVVDVLEGLVDRLDPVFDIPFVAVQLGREPRDVSDGVLIEVVLELPFEAGEVVLGHPPVQLPVIAARFDRVVDIGGLLRIPVTELRHRRDHTSTETVLRLTGLSDVHG